MIMLQLFFLFVKLGFFSFGGGYAIVSIIQSELEKFGWITAQEYANMVTISQITPGPLAINIATYVGAKVFEDYGPMMSVFGSFLATLGVTLPSFILVILAAKLYNKVYKKKQTQWVMMGIRPAVIGLLANAIIFFLQLSIFSDGRFAFYYVFITLNFSALAIFAVVLLVNLKTKLGIVPLILISAVLGIMIM